MAPPGTCDTRLSRDCTITFAPIQKHHGYGARHMNTSATLPFLSERMSEEGVLLEGSLTGKSGTAPPNVRRSATVHKATPVPTPESERLQVDEPTEMVPPAPVPPKAP